MSPYPGGKHGPGHYVGGGGGGFLQGDIRIGSVGATEVGAAAGSAQHTIPAASANVGDELWTVTHATGNLGVEVSGNWNSHANINFGRQRLWKRIADGTANDDFVMPANLLFVVAKMWSLQKVIGGVDFPSLLFQGGFNNPTFQVPWEVGFPNVPPAISLTNNIVNDPNAFVLMFAFQWTRFQPGAVAPTIANAPATAMETIMDEAHFAATAPFATDTLYTLVQFAYTNPSVQYDAYPVGFTPATQSLAQWTQHQRFEIT